MLGNEDFQPFLGLTASIVERSKLRNFNRSRLRTQEIPYVGQAVHLHLPKAALQAAKAKNWNARKCPANGCSRDMGASKMSIEPCQM